MILTAAGSISEILLTIVSILYLLLFSFLCLLSKAFTQFSIIIPFLFKNARIIIAKNLKMNSGHSYANSQNRDSSSALTWENRSLG